MAKKTTKAAAKKAAPAKKAATKKAAPAKKAATKKAAPAKKPAAKKAKAKATDSGFMKALTPSETLAEVIGTGSLPRTEAISKIWTYIKKNNLQNPKNKRNILADAKLKKLFGKNEVTMFELAGIIGKHLS